MWRRRYIPHTSLSVGSACHNAQCFVNNAAKAHMAAFRRLRTLCFIDAFVGETSKNNKPVINEDGKRY